MPSHSNHLRSMVDQDGAAILDTKLGRISTLNSTGAYIWEALERGLSKDGIVEQLARDTGESSERIAADVETFIESLKEQHLWNGTEGGAA